MDVGSTRAAVIGMQMVGHGEIAATAVVAVVIGTAQMGVSARMDAAVEAGVAGAVVAGSLTGGRAATSLHRTHKAVGSRVVVRAKGVVTGIVVIPTVARAIGTTSTVTRAIAARVAGV